MKHPNDDDISDIHAIRIILILVVMMLVLLAISFYDWSASHHNSIEEIQDYLNLNEVENTIECFEDGSCAIYEDGVQIGSFCKAGYLCND